ncbi:unnamed protein product [Symbiodinium sp. CCMP2592]|nr:unnamed protein product [Symbiodinium sp. CCMP2592]
MSSWKPFWLDAGAPCAVPARGAAIRTMIKFILMVNKQGQTRLAQYYEFLSVRERVTLEGELIRKCLSRSESQCSFVEYRDYRVVYRRYASLYFIVGIDNDEDCNELAILEFIHTLVETLDKYFENVCELDIMSIPLPAGSTTARHWHQSLAEPAGFAQLLRPSNASGDKAKGVDLIAYVPLPVPCLDKDLVDSFEPEAEAMRLLLWTAMLESLSLGHSATNAEWGHSINMAGLQRTLSQRMSKEFLLISLGIDGNVNKETFQRSLGDAMQILQAKLQQSVQDFNSTLYALIRGDPQQGIVAAPNARVAENLQKVLRLWVPFEILLTSSMDSVRSLDGSINVPVLEAVSSQNGPLLDASNVVVGGLVDAAKVSGASTNGLVQDIAGRQRTYIQSLCLKALLVSQGVSLVENKASLKETKLLFEASHAGIIEGVPFAGVPVLTNVCTLHQMSEVTFYYSKVRPLVSEILNAHTVQSSQDVAISSICMHINVHIYIYIHIHAHHL